MTCSVKLSIGSATYHATADYATSPAEGAFVVLVVPFSTSAAARAFVRAHATRGSGS